MGKEKNSNNKEEKRDDNRNIPEDMPERSRLPEDRGYPQDIPVPDPETVKPPMYS